MLRSMLSCSTRIAGIHRPLATSINISIVNNRPANLINASKNLKSFSPAGAMLTMSRRSYFDNPVTHSGPSTTTSVLLQHLPNSVTEAVLSEAIKEAAVGCKKVQLEPGCSLHFIQEHEAHFAADVIQREFGYQTQVSSATVPCLALHNIPDSCSVEQLRDKFAAFDPIDITLSGVLSTQFVVEGAAAAVRAANAVQSLHFEGRQLKTTAVRLSGERYLLTAFNFPTTAATTTTATEALLAVNAALQAAAVDTLPAAADVSATDGSSGGGLQFAPRSDVSVTARLVKAPTTATTSATTSATAVTSGVSQDVDVAALQSVKQSLQQLSIDGAAVVAVKVRQNLPKPALFVRHLQHVRSPDHALATLLLPEQKTTSTGSTTGNNAENSTGIITSTIAPGTATSTGKTGAASDLSAVSGLERVQYLRKFRDRPATMAVLYFSSQQAAFDALQKLHNAAVDGRRISTSYREVTEPAIRISNLPENANEKELAALFPADMKIVRLSIQKQQQQQQQQQQQEQWEAVAVLESPHDVEIAQLALSRKIYRSSRLRVAALDVGDIGLEVTLSPTAAAVASEVSDFDAIEQRISSSIATAAAGAVAAKSFAFSSNASAFVSFRTLEQATKARSFVLESNSSNSSGEMKASFGVSVAPAHVLQVANLPTDVSVSDLLHRLQNHSSNNSSSSSGLDLQQVLQINRAALVKFRRHKEVVPGMKLLRSLQLQLPSPQQQQQLRVSRYRPLAPEGSSEYDALDAGHRVPLRARSKLPILASLLPSSLTNTAAATAVDVEEEEGDDVDGEGSYQRAKHDVAFDRVTTQLMLQDYMQTEPALRYKIAKNTFERALFDAKASNDVSLLVGSELSREAQAEAKQLFFNNAAAVAGKSEEQINQRLFDLFLQKQDMERFSSDLDDFQQLFGAATGNTTGSSTAVDGFSWSQFEVEDGDDVKRLRAQLAAADEIALEEMVAQIRGNSRKKKLSFGDSDEDIDTDDATVDSFSSGGSSDGGNALDLTGSERSKQQQLQQRAVNIVVKGDSPDSDTVVSVGPPSSFSSSTTAAAGNDNSSSSSINSNPLRDKDGFVWSACILDTDMVQKTMPGNRVNSHRALVVVGNLRGAAGFGMGKGKTGADAVNAACRAALRNLTHIDLYDNFGLAHDLHGRHNSCHCYIRATPSSRRLVASPFAAEVLLRFGISSASVKMVGRRNPYSQVRALFAALAEHQNIDEFAKARGKRYLTLRWAHEQNL